LDVAGQEIRAGQVVVFGVHGYSSQIALNIAEVVSVKPRRGTYPWTVTIVRRYASGDVPAALYKLKNFFVVADSLAEYHARIGVAN
jgi:hypothetical protein